MNSSILKMNLDSFLDFLKANQIRRFYFTYDDESGVLSFNEPALVDVQKFLIQDKRDFAQHEAIFMEASADYNYLLAAFLHSTHRGQGHGGVRLWTYSNMEEFFRDGLRLAQGMTQKNALAYLWWGGGKGLISYRSDFDMTKSSNRDRVFSDYGKFLSSLQGCYYSAEDVGVKAEDLESMFRETRFMSCIAPEKGGSGNPSVRTANGVLRAIEAALEFKGQPGLPNKTVVVQGLGNVGFNLCQFLFEAGVQKIIGSDINQEFIDRAEKLFPKSQFTARRTERGDESILSENCDILAPCATGAILNSRTIPKLNCKIVCGGANNQLEDPSLDDQALFDRGIIYVPDFLANRMGIVNCANEQYGYVNPDPIVQQHLSYDWEYSVYQTTLRVLNESQNSKLPPGAIALRQANELAKEKHPVFGRRGKQIVQSLVRSQWAKSNA